MSVSPFFNPKRDSQLGEMMRDMGGMQRRLMPISGTFNPMTDDSEIMNSNDKFAVNLNVSNFKPEELKVNLEGRQLSIQGEHDVENEHGASRKSFSRMILLPEDVDITSVATNLSNDGKLCIEAPKLEGVCGRSVPVKEASMDHHHIE